MQASKDLTRTAIASHANCERGRLDNGTHFVMVDFADRASCSRVTALTVIAATKKGWKN